MKFIKNAAQCLYCGDIVESKYRHDWVSCSCWDDPMNENEVIRHHGIFVDGGLSDPRHGWSNIDEYQDLTIKEENATDN